MHEVYQYGEQFARTSEVFSNIVYVIKYFPMSSAHSSFLLLLFFRVACVSPVRAHLIWSTIYIGYTTLYTDIFELNIIIPTLNIVRKPDRANHANNAI